MAKLKLKTVQNGTGNESQNLLENGSPSYVNDQGYSIFGSGILDNSGNVVDQGWIEIQGGSGTLELGIDPVITLDVTWGSGDFILPLPVNYGAQGCETCVDVSFGTPSFGVSAGWTILDITDVESYGLNPLCVRWSFGYTRCRFQDYDHPILDSETGTFTIPFIYHKPIDEED